MITITLLLWALLLPWLLGFTLISMAEKHTKSLPTLQKIPLAFLLGTSTFSMCLFILSLLGIYWNRGWISIAFGLFSTVLLCIVYLGKRKYQLNSIPKITVKLNLVNGVLVGLIIFKLFTIFFLALDKPITDWDAWANWSLKAKVFYYEKGVPLEPNYPYFAGGGHVNYPLQIPILEAWVYTVTDQWNDQIVKVIFPLYATFFLSFLYSFLSERIGSTKSLLSCLLFITLPFVSYHASSAYMDLPVGIYIGVATMLLWLYLSKRETIYLMLFYILFAFAGWIKNEGFLLFLVTLFFLLITFTFQKVRKSNSYAILIKSFIANKQAFLAATVGVIVLLPWLYFKWTFGLGISNFGTKDILPNISTIHYRLLPVLLKNLTTTANFNLLLPLFLFGILVYRKIILREKLFYFILLNIIYFVTYLSIYLLTQNYSFILDGTIFHRNLLTIIPSIFWLTALIYGIQSSDYSKS